MTSVSLRRQDNKEAKWGLAKWNWSKLIKLASWWFNKGVDTFSTRGCMSLLFKNSFGICGKVIFVSS